MKNNNKLLIYLACVLLIITEFIKFKCNYYFGFTGTLLTIFKVVSYVSVFISLIVMIVYIPLKLDTSNQKQLKWLDFIATLFIFCNFISGAILAYYPFKYGEDYDDIKKAFKKSDTTRIPKVESVLKYPKWVYFIYFVAVVSVYFIPFPKSLMIVHTSTGFVYGELIMYPLLLLITLVLFFDEFYNGYCIFIKNFKKYLYIMLKVVVYCMVANIIVSLLASIVLHTNSVNEGSLAGINRFVMIIMAVSYAPIVEEMLFRVVIKKFITNSTLFIIVSSLSFGLFHTIGSETQVLNFIIFTLVYSVPGFMFATLYDKTNNIAVPSFVHAAMNFIAGII